MKWLQFIPRKVQYAVATAVTTALMGIIKSKWPDLELPTTPQIVGLGASIIGGHAITDVAAVLKGK